MRMTAITAAIFTGGLFFATNGPAANIALTNQQTSNKLNANHIRIGYYNKPTNAKKTIEKVAAVTPAPAPAPVIVTVQAGDNLSKLATAHNTTALRLFYANVSIQDPDLIYAGQQLRVPTPDEQLAPRAVPIETPAPVRAAPASPAPRTRASVSRPAPVVLASANTSVWDRLAACESSGNWAINTGNGFYGGLQFTLSSWRAVGGSGYPNHASREEQIMRAQKLQAIQGWGAWPACTAKLGIR